MARRVKIMRGYTDKEMGGVHIPEGAIITFDNKKAQTLIESGIAQAIVNTRKKPK